MSRPLRQVFIGVDIGTQGVRAVAVDDAGDLVASAMEPFSWVVDQAEQDAEIWILGVLDVLARVAAELAKDGRLPSVRALSVTSTSGTVVPLDREHRPLHRALMYSDRRSALQADLCSSICGRPMNASFGLPKMVWFKDEYPDEAGRIALWSHPGDYVIGKLCGAWGYTDYTTALKSGYDPAVLAWPESIDRVGVDRALLPRAVPPGSLVGILAESIVDRTGLPAGTQVAVGMTDGCASQIAAGSVLPGTWNSTIGTTLVIKGVTKSPVYDPLGRVYNHLHPEGHWMPGGASNTGASWVAQDYGQEDLDALNRGAEKWLPTPWLSYPLLQSGERFPFVRAGARGFDAHGLSPEQRFASRMEGVAYLERMSVNLMETLSGERIASVMTGGGASGNSLWLQIRSNVLGRPILRTRHSSAAFGAAIIAASRTAFDGLSRAGTQMTHLQDRVEPDGRERAYDERYRAFVAALLAKGYIERSPEWEV